MTGAWWLFCNFRANGAKVIEFKMIFYHWKLINKLIDGFSIQSLIASSSYGPFCLAFHIPNMDTWGQ
jgi:hypothetical protein